MVCALVGTWSEDDLWLLAKSNFENLNFSAFDGISNTNSLFRKFNWLLKEGHFIDKAPLIKFMQDNTNFLTFWEAHAISQKVINITVTDSSSWWSHILNYITSPNVFVWSASIASCALPLLYSSANIYMKTKDGSIERWLPPTLSFIDGSFGGDIPLKALATTFNITNFIVS